MHVLSHHPALPVIINALRSNNLMKDFWKTHIDPHIHKDKPYKSSLAFILLNLLPVDTKTDFVSFLTVNFMETSLFLLTKLESSAEEDKAILDVFGKLITVAKENPDTQIPILKALLTNPGNISFDKVTGGNIVHQLTTLCSVEAVKYLGSLYRSALAGVPDGGRDVTTQERVYSAHQLAKLVGHPVLQNEKEWKAETIEFILALTLFDVKKPVGPVKSIPTPLGREAKLEVKNAFFKSLDVKVRSFEGTCEVLRRVAYFANQGSNATPYFLCIKRVFCKNFLNFCPRPSTINCYQLIWLPFGQNKNFFFFTKKPFYTLCTIRCWRFIFLSLIFWL